MKMPSCVTVNRLSEKESLEEVQKVENWIASKTRQEKSRRRQNTHYSG